MMKRKIMFMLINMNVGGTEKALLNLVTRIPKDQFEVTIFMLEKFGGFLQSIPEGVKVEFFRDYDSIKPVLNSPPHKTVKELFKKRQMVKASIIAMLHLLSKLTKKRGLFFKYILFKYPKIKKKYDIAVAYDGPMDFISYFILKKVEAKKKVQWIHFDVSKIGFNKKFASYLYENFNKIFVVSEESKKELIKKLPFLNEKSQVFYNIVSPELIRLKAKEGNGFMDGYQGTRILTVGRLADEKGQDIAIEVLKRIKLKGYNVKWYCLGEGSQRYKYEQLIKQFNLEDDFLLLGSDPNPYPYMEQCDIYVQPSRHEGYCITLQEARCLCKPIVTTNFIAAKEQINSGENGMVVNMDSNELFKAIEELILNKDMRKKFSDNLKMKELNNEYELSKLLIL